MRSIYIISVVALGCILLVGLWNVGRVALAFALIWLASLNAIDRDAAARSGYAKIPQARQIDAILGQADHSVMNEGDETDEGVREEWISNVYFGGRYELDMRVDIRVDRRTSEVTRVLAEPKFRLLEIERIDIDSSGVSRISYDSSGQREFGTEEWDRIVAANGDFSVAGIELSNDPPIPNFDALVRWSRKAAHWQPAP